MNDDTIKNTPSSSQQYMTNSVAINGFIFFYYMYTTDITKHFLAIIP